jgi:hypothetical protein
MEAKEISSPGAFSQRCWPCHSKAMSPFAFSKASVPQAAGSARRYKVSSLLRFKKTAND